MELRMRRKADWMSFKVIIVLTANSACGYGCKDCNILPERHRNRGRDAAVSPDGARPVSTAKKRTKVSRATTPKHYFRNAPFEQGQSPFQTYATLENPLTLGFQMSSPLRTHT